MKLILKSIFTLALLSLLGANLYSQDKVFLPGEELVYEVSFMGVKLGTVSTYAEAEETIDGNKTYRVKGLIDSYDGIPFVDIFVEYKSWMDPTISFSRQFTGNTRLEANKWSFNKLFFQYNNNKIIGETWEGNNKVWQQDYSSNRKWNDGLSLFFLARKFLYFGKSIKIPTFITPDTVSTTINFYGKKENIKINSIDHPVRTVYFDGDANWKGVYGLSGKFEGWFSDDEARIPIRARMNVYVGKVNIELKSWKRAGWNPPK